MHFNQKKTSIIVLLFVASLLVVLPIQIVKAQTSTTTVTVTPQTSTPVVGQTITISIQLNNVQNLYAIALTLTWNPSMLSLQTNSNQTFVGVETYSNGVLHNPTSVFQDSASQATGEYNLAATSYGSAGAFSGSGTIATMKFTVTSAGQSSLTLNSTLANYDPSGSEPIAHTDVSGTVDATTSSSSSPSTSPTSSSSSSSSPSSSPSSSSSPSPSSSKSTPFLVLLAIIAVVVIVLVSVAVLLSRKMMKRTVSASS